MKITRIDKVKRERRVVLDLNYDEAVELRGFLDPHEPFVKLSESSRLIQMLDQLRHLDRLPIEEVGEPTTVFVDGSRTSRGFDRWFDGSETMSGGFCASVCTECGTGWIDRAESVLTCPRCHAPAGCEVTREGRRLVLTVVSK